MLRTTRWVTGSALRDLVLFVLAWGWMVQLLIPYAKATKIPAVSPFLIYLGALFAVDFLLGNRIGRVALKIILLCSFIYYNYYFANPLFDPAWIKHWGTDVFYSIHLAVTQHFELVPDAVYTTLFLIVLWLMQSFYRQSLRSRSWVVVFLILGSTGLGVIDSFFIDVNSWQIVLYVLLGLCILAFVQLPVIERTARMPQRMKGWPGEWLTWTLVLSLIVVGTGWAAPKNPHPSWPDPVSYLEGKASNGPGQQKIGYGSDDSHLGGPFQMDDGVAFTVVTDTEGYYRGETKTVYTGSGWLPETLGSAVPNLQDLTSIEMHDPANPDSKKVVQTYSFKENMQPVVFSEYRMTGVQGVADDPLNVNYSDPDTRLTIGELKAGTTLTVTSQVPYFVEQTLEKASVPDLSAGFGIYTQLPSTLPQRVRDLARQITANAKTPYERAQALESYLRNNYTYDTQNVPVPAKGQDYVDQFLFDSKRGYCDNFSSAFVVMARSLGIPTRWVKGFTTGDVDLSYQSSTKDQYLYVVRNKNAHSWPEVYFAGVGWVPFEPTATFVSIPRLYKPDASTQTLAPVVPIPTPKHPVHVTPQDNLSAATTSFEINWQTVGVDALYLLVVLLIVAFLFRRKLLTWFFLRRAYRSDDAVHELERLFKIMARFGWRRREDMTLREYADYLANSYELRGREMIPLARVFERVRYGHKEASEQEKSQFRELWTRIIRKAGRFKDR